MKHQELILALCLPALSGGAQDIVQLYPVQDAIIAIHPGFPTSGSNYDWAGHFAGISQPGNQGGANIARGLMSFDLSSIPSDATIFGAFLDLTGCGPTGIGAVSSVGHVGNNSCTLRRVTDPWNAASVTWNTQPGVSPNNEVLLNTSTYATQNYLNINVTALVQDMIIQPLSSFGFQISLVDEQVTRGLVFYSSEAPTPDLWPALTVVYGNCDLTTAMEEHDATNLALRPSLVPRNGEIILDGKEERTSLIFIFDMAGSIVRSIEAKQWPSRIGLEGLASGTYILTAQDAQHHVIFRDKFVIE